MPKVVDIRNFRTACHCEAYARPKRSEIASEIKMPVRLTMSPEMISGTSTTPAGSLMNHGFFDFTAAKKFPVRKTNEKIATPATMPIMAPRDLNRTSV